MALGRMGEKRGACWQYLFAPVRVRHLILIRMCRKAKEDGDFGVTRPGINRTMEDKDVQEPLILSTGISSQIRTRLRDWAFFHARVDCYSRAALS